MAQDFEEEILENKMIPKFDEEGGVEKPDPDHSEGWFYFDLDDENKKLSKLHLHEIDSPSTDKIDLSDKYQDAKVKHIPLSMRKIEGMDIKDAIKENVLPFLPAKILTKFRSVSTQWDRWIQTPFLAHLQTHTFHDLSGFFFQQYDTAPLNFLNLDPTTYGVPTPRLNFLPGPIDLIGSCHGLLVCQVRDGNNSYVVCNPATKNWKQLPNPEYYHGPNSAHVLAFDSRLNNIEGNYQLVCAMPLLGQPIVCFEIYSSETGSWRCSDTICAELGEDFQAEGPGFYMKGTAYWVTSMMSVLAYDLKNEVYGIIPLPTESSQGGILAQIEDELCYVSISNTSDDNFLVRIYSGYDLRLRQGIDLQLEGVPAGVHGTYRVLACVGGEKLMILVGSVVYSYGLSDEKVEVVSNEGGVVSERAKIVPYVNSLVRVV